MRQAGEGKLFAVLIAGGLLFFSSWWGGIFRAGAQDEGTASLYLGPAAGTFTVGSTFNVSLYLNTGGKFVNAIEAHIAFPPDKLQVVSPATAARSFIDIWASPPRYSNKEGTITFQGGVHKPGINTASGVVSIITFRVRDTGPATVRIADDSRVFAADGTGADILTKTTGALFTLTFPPPAGPLVASPTHPDQGGWYNGKEVVFRWEAPPDIQGYSYALNASSVEEPDSISEGVRTNVSYQDISDGIWYFHIKSLRNGVWGGVTHYGVKIDKTPPAEFQVEISPSGYTSRRQPILAFGTTDAVSGVDHYELKVIRLDARKREETKEETPFFFEITPPYTERFELGKYHAIVRAFDLANNYTQAVADLTIVNPLLEIIQGQGVRLGGTYTIAWPYAITIGLLLFGFLLYFLRGAWILHRRVERELEQGVLDHPAIGKKLQELKKKQEEYKRERNNTVAMALLILFVSAQLLWGPSYAFGEEGRGAKNVKLEPPVVTLFSADISNDEIPYIGGRASAPKAEVIVTLQNTEVGTSFTDTVVTDKDGAWFYSFPEFLAAGDYQVWTQLRAGEEMSQPSSRLELRVAPTAIQIGGRRINYQELYLTLFLIFAGACTMFLVFALYHFYHFRKKRSRLLKEIKEAEESVRRGFSVLRRDIQAELEILHKVKLNKELSAEEKIWEEKLLRDFEWANAYVGKEVWEVEKAERALS